MSNIWFTSDTHFGHENVIKYSKRPWSNVEEMNEGLIERWNARVGPKDTVYHLGDFCLTKRIDLIDPWLERLNGKIHLVKGNHDDWTRRFDRLLQKNKTKIEWIRDYAEKTFSVDGKKWKFVLCHFPLLFWHHSHHGSIMLHGHCHGSANQRNLDVRRLDVGVDCHDWYPIALEDIIISMKDIGFNDHHGNN